LSKITHASRTSFYGKDKFAVLYPFICEFNDRGIKETCSMVKTRKRIISVFIQLFNAVQKAVV